MSRSIIHDHVQLSLNSGHDVKNVIYPENTETDVLVTSRANIGTLSDLITALGELAFYNAEDIIINDIIPDNTYTKLNILSGATEVPTGALIVVPDDYGEDGSALFSSSSHIRISTIENSSDGSEINVGDYVIKTDYRADVTFSAKKIMEILDNLELSIAENYVTIDEFTKIINEIFMKISQLENNINIKIESTFNRVIDEHITPIKIRLSELDDYLDFGSIYSAYYDLDTAYIRNYFAKGRANIGVEPNENYYTHIYPSYEKWLGSIESNTDDDGATQIKEIVPLNRKWSYIPLETMYELWTRDNKTYTANDYRLIDNGSTQVSVKRSGSSTETVVLWQKATHSYAESLFTQTNGAGRNTSIFGDVTKIKAAMIRGEAVEEILPQPTNSKLIMHSYRKLKAGESTNADGVYEVVDNVGMQYFFDANNTWKNEILLSINNYRNLPNILKGEKVTISYEKDENNNIIETRQTVALTESPFSTLNAETKTMLNTMYENYMNHTHGGIDTVNKKIEYFYIMGDIYDVKVGDYVKEISPNDEEYIDISQCDDCISYKEVREDNHCGIIYAGGYVTPFVLNKDCQTFDVNVDTTTLPPHTDLTDIYPTLGTYYWPFPCTGIVVPDMLKMHNKSRTHQITISDSGIKTSNVINLSHDQKINVYNIGNASAPSTYFNAFENPSDYEKYQDPETASSVHPLNVSIEAKYKVEVCRNYNPNSNNNDWKICYYCAPALDNDKIYLNELMPAGISSWRDVPDKWRGRMKLNAKYMPTNAKNPRNTYSSDRRHPIGNGYTLLMWLSARDPNEGAIIASWDFMPKNGDPNELNMWDDEYSGRYVLESSYCEYGYYNGSNYSPATSFETHISDSSTASILLRYSASRLLAFWREVLFGSKNPFIDSSILLTGANCGDNRWKDFDDLAVEARANENTTTTTYVAYSNSTYRITRISASLSRADLSIESSNNHFRLLAKFL